MLFRFFLVLFLAHTLVLPSQARPKLPKGHGVSLGGIILTDVPPNEGRSTKLPYTPVTDVEVTLSGDALPKEMDSSKLKSISDEKGFFHFDELPKGSYTLVFVKAGFVTVTKDAAVEDAAGFPTNLRITMNPRGYTGGSEQPSGSGTVYVAFGERQASVVSNSRDGGGMSIDTDPVQAIAAGADPLTLGGNPVPSFNPNDAEQNLTSDDPNTLMIYPPTAPSRTWFSKLSSRPFWVCFNKTGSVLYVSTAEQTILVFDSAHGNRLLANLPAKGPVTDLTPSLDGRYILASVIGNDGVLVVDTNINEATNFLPCLSSPRAAAMSGGRIFVVEGANSSGQLEALDCLTGKRLGLARVGANPTGIAVTPDGKRLLVVNSGSASVSVLDALTLSEQSRIQVGVNPTKVAICPDGSRAVVTNKGSDSVSLIDLQSMAVVSSIPVGQGPIGVVISLDSQRAYVGCKDSGTVVMLDLRSCRLMHTSIPMPHSAPYGLAIRP